MKCSSIVFTTACTLLLSLHTFGALAQAQATRVHGSRLVRHSALAVSTSVPRSGGVSTTLDNQILLELRAGDTADPNPVDLEGQTLVFTPDGHGGYSRSVQPLAWEDHLGEAVADEAVVELESFMFDFAGQRWGAFHVSRHGLLTFGAPFAWSYYRDGRFFTMREIAAAFVHSPTISPLYAPAFGDWRQGVDDRDSGRFVARWSDRIVVTWIVRDTQSYVRAVPTGPNRFQAVLHADGSVQFNYADITSGDGIAGLFSNVVQKGDLIASVVDATDPGLPGHLDLLDAAIYTSNTDAVIVEFTLRDSIREPPAGEHYSYRLHFDTDEPYWNHPLDWSDEDATWQIDVREGGEYTAHGNGVRGFLAGKGEASISLLADASVLQGDSRGIRAMAVAGAAHFRGDQWVQGDYDSHALLQFPSPEASRRVDLSTADRSFSPNQYEVFHNRGLPDLGELACRVIDNLGDEFDFMVFHNEFEVDSQEAGSPVSPYAYIPGTGTPKRGSPCGQGRLKALLVRPISMHTFYAPNLDNVLGQVAHEFGHVWSAYLSYSKAGRRESLVDDICRCHWRFELHTPAPFPPRGRQDAGSHMSVSPPGSAVGGGFWHENADGTFTPGRVHPELSGPSWLDLYLMGMADAHEVPDMFILRNLQPLNDGSGAYRADKETVTIEQIVAAEGPRVPSAADSQKVFNVGFVYLVERGQRPAADLLQLHARYIGELRDRWFGFTGERSRITTVFGRAPNRPPVPVGTLPPLTIELGEAPVSVEVAGAFRDPDGDSLTYRATSSEPDVVSVSVSKSTVTVTPEAAGMAVVTVTATDTDGSNKTATQTFAVTVVEMGGIGSSLFVPIVLRSQGRTPGSFFTSELTLTNRGSTTADIHYTYTASFGGGSGTAVDSLGAGEQRVIPDAIAYLTSLGIPIGSGSAGGTLVVDFSNLSSPSDAAVTVRVSTPVEEERGRAGLAFMGLNRDGLLTGSAFIPGLRRDRQDRSNVAVQNAGIASDGTVTLRVTVFSGDPAATVRSIILPDLLTLDPGGFHQYNGILKMAGFDNGYVKVERVDGTAPFYAYGVVNDNFNSDGSFVFPVRRDSLEGKRGQTLPVIIETGNFTSELTVTNFSSVAKTVDFRFVADAVNTDDDTAGFSLKLEAGQQLILPRIVDWLRQRQVAGIGVADKPFVGALFATVAEGDMSGIVIGARTGSPDEGGGQYSLFYNGVPYGSALVESAWVYGLQQNEENRSNLALVNTGEVNDSSSTLEITIYDGSGESQPRTITKTVAARRWHQVNGILGNFSQGYVQVRKISGNNPFVTYGVINDGGAPGQRSGDGAYQPAQP